MKYAFALAAAILAATPAMAQWSSQSEYLTDLRAMHLRADFDAYRQEQDAYRRQEQTDRDNQRWQDNMQRR